MNTDLRLIAIHVVYAENGQQFHQYTVHVPPGCPAKTVLAELPCPPFPAEPVAFGVWGKKITGSTVLQDGDRLEIYRALHHDPMVARRLRATRKGRTV